MSAARMGIEFPELEFTHGVFRLLPETTNTLTANSTAIRPRIWEEDFFSDFLILVYAIRSGCTYYSMTISPTDCMPNLKSYMRSSSGLFHIRLLLYAEHSSHSSSSSGKICCLSPPKELSSPSPSPAKNSTGCASVFLMSTRT